MSKKILISTLIFVGCLFFAKFSFAAQIQFNYRVHVQNYGWLNPVHDGEIAGTIGKNLQMESVIINLTKGEKNFIQYVAHVQNIGWQDWKNSGEIAGTTGKALRMEAIRIKLMNGLEKDFEIYYRAYVQNYGWLGWAKNGEPAGTAGMALQMEALQIKIVKRGTNFERGGAAFHERKIIYGTET